MDRVAVMMQPGELSACAHVFGCCGRVAEADQCFLHADPSHAWVKERGANVPGHPLVCAHASSSPKKHCSHTNALRASPLNASSRSAPSPRWAHSAACASEAARPKSCTTGIVSACSKSRWRSHVARESS